jgi:phage terminase large subunit GpA-like protein
MGAGVYPIVGRGRNQAGGDKHFREASTSTGTQFIIGVDLYKDRWGAALKRKWSGDGLQPSPFFNAPSDATDKQLKELTVEKRIAMKRQTTGEILYYSWHRPNGVQNELWDLLVYADASHDIMAKAFCVEELGLEDVDDAALKTFWDACEEHQFFFHE